MAGFGLHKGSDNDNVRKTDDNDVWPLAGLIVLNLFIFWTRRKLFFFFFMFEGMRIVFLFKKKKEKSILFNTYIFFF